MGKRIIVTSGPTNERIDAVMQITNMSTGALGSMIAHRLLEDASVEKVYYISPKLAYKPQWPFEDGRLECTRADSAQDLLSVIRKLLSDKNAPIDAMVHAAAVGDYKGRYAARAEDVAQEIAEAVEEAEAEGGTLSAAEILEILSAPKCVQDDSTKISSYEPNLMIMLDLTPKIIGEIKKLSPDTMLIGCKLLEDVPEQELFRVASRLRRKNNADFIIANDLARIGNGRHPAMIIGRDLDDPEKDAVTATCETKDGIAECVAGLILAEDP